MGDNEGGASGNPPSEGDMTQFAVLCKSVFNSMSSQIRSLVKEEADKKKVVEAPKLTHKGLSAQAELNAEILTLICPLLSHEDEETKTIAEKIDKKLRKRNQDLTVADKSPAGFKTLEKMEAIQSLGSDSDDTMKVLALSQLLARSEEPPAKRRFDQPFPRRNSDNSRFEFRNNQGFNPTSRSGPKCYNCHQPGHYANTCRQRRN